ncbi:MAG: hypothetical protein SCH72_14995, partial [Desulfuromonadales bacterium]|nr:hypothetical protein [Desulfuromonadales bacterium]
HVEKRDATRYSHNHQRLVVAGELAIQTSFRYLCWLSGRSKGMPPPLDRPEIFSAALAALPPHCTKAQFSCVAPYPKVYAMARGKA